MVSLAPEQQRRTNERTNEGLAPQAGRKELEAKGKVRKKSNMRISNEEITVAVIRKETLSWRDLLFALEMPDAAQWDELNQITVVAVKSIATSDVVDGGVE